jgi:hypothetical protein
MHDTIHIDEKWFYMTKANERYYLMSGEEEPHRTCKSKSHIAKIIVLCVVARPIHNFDTGECIFDGKIGVYPFIERVGAIRKSHNRPRGTLETKPVDAITQTVIKRCHIYKV